MCELGHRGSANRSAVDTDAADATDGFAAGDDSSRVVSNAHTCKAFFRLRFGATGDSNVGFHGQFACRYGGEHAGV